MINCEAGISRSPGVAIGIASVLKTDPDIKELKRLFPCTTGPFRSWSRMPHVL